MFKGFLFHIYIYIYPKKISTGRRNESGRYMVHLDPLRTAKSSVTGGCP